MSKTPRLDAPAADLRALDRGPACTKVFGTEPRITPTRAEEMAKLESRWEADKLAKADSPVADVHGNGNVTCTTANRPSKGLRAGMMIFDLTLDRPLWRNAKNTAWITAAGISA